MGYVEKLSLELFHFALLLVGMSHLPVIQLGSFTGCISLFYNIWIHALVSVCECSHWLLKSESNFMLLVQKENQLEVSISVLQHSFQSILR